MNSDQAIHVGMINSYNLLTGKANFEEIISAGIGVFAHLPDQDIALDNIEFMVFYFQEQEMFEHCANLKEYIKNNYNEDGSPKLTDCECEYPLIDKYSIPMYCAYCEKRLKQ
jgi:hypothetical protein